MNSIDAGKHTTSWIFRVAQAAAIFAVVAFCATTGCVNADEDAVEKRTGALGTFSAWQNLSTPKGQDGAPSIVQVVNQQVAFSATAASSPLSVFFSTRTFSLPPGSPGSWSAWTALPDSPQAFKERPAAVAFDVPSSSPLFGKIALVGRKSDDSYYVRIQDVTGSVMVQNWTAIAGTWTSQPALGFIPASSRTAPKNTLVVVGRGQDGRFWFTQNTLNAQNAYVHANWTGPTSPFGSQKFTSAPAVTYACPPSVGAASMVVVGMSNSSMLVNTHNGSGFQTWATSSGTFLAGDPALAVGCMPSTSEVSTYGIGQNGGIWVSPVVNGNALSWNQIGTTPFRGIAATGSIATVTVTGKTSTGTPPDLQGMSTWTTSTTCAANQSCGSNAFCELPTIGCGASQGTCAVRPTTCPREIVPVCGCDGISYGNDCERQAAGVPKRFDGICEQ